MQIRVLNLAHNAITNIEKKDFSEFLNLTDLNLSFNKLSKLDFLEPLEYLEVH